MTAVYFSQRTLSDLERVFDFLARKAPAIATEAANEIVYCNATH